MPTVKAQTSVPGYYVDRMGRVYSAWKTRRRSCGGRGVESFISDRLKEMKLRDHNQGYFAVALRRDGRYVYYLVHRLVLETFVGPCPEGAECLHADDNKHNNHLDNLIWGTKSKNAHDAVRNGRNWQVKAGAEEIQAQINSKLTGQKRTKDQRRRISAGAKKRFEDSERRTYLV